MASGLDDIFNDQRVRQLKEDEIGDLVQDDYVVRMERQELRAKEATLIQGKEICQQIGRRPDLGPVSL
jgi:hypothetical protein